MTYFHAVIPRTIIGAAAFHGPVRDGKAWFHRAMVVRNPFEPGAGDLGSGDPLQALRCAMASHLIAFLVGLLLFTFSASPRVPFAAR
jgi:hypothetical protein